MLTIRARNVNDAYPQALQMIQSIAVRRDSREGKVLMLPEPLAIRYTQPTERVLFDERRNANPFFHLLESVWMLAGRNDVQWLAQWLPRMAQYSDNGQTFHGAYGYRWRNHFIYNSERRFDQLITIVEMLRKGEPTRRAVLGMWDPTADLDRTSKDLPCNLSVVFGVDRGALNMTVYNRSNDLILGALGANVVHFSVLQEVIASWLNLDVGWYEQVSANAHVYVAEWERRGYHQMDHSTYDVKDPYHAATTPWHGWITGGDGPHVFLHKVEDAVRDNFVRAANNRWLDEVVSPIVAAYRVYKSGDPRLALDIADTCDALDWRLACTEWIERRVRK